MLPAMSAIPGVPFSNCTAYRMWFTTWSCVIIEQSNINRFRLVSERVEWNQSGYLFSAVRDRESNAAVELIDSLSIVIEW